MGACEQVGLVKNWVSEQAGSIPSKICDNNAF